MANSIDEFEPWLNDKLKNLNTDEGVFSSYISGIVCGEESFEDKRFALLGILSEIIEEKDIETHVTEILDKWSSCQPKNEEAKQVANVEVQLAKLLGNQSLATIKKREYTDEEKKIREAILSQYSQLSDSEEQHEEGPGAKQETVSSNDLVKNTNASDVAAASRERREQARQDAQKKKDKDREDREKQKQLKQDKKEKRKTTKGERKR